MKKILLFGAIALSINAFAQLPSYVPTNGLVGWWPFDNNANDLSGNNNDGIVNGGATLVTDHLGNPSSAYEFDGIDDQINVPHSSSLLFANNEISISVWLSINQLPSNNLGQNFISKQVGQGSTQDGFHLVLSDISDLLVYRYRGGAAQPQTTTFEELSDLPVGAYFHLVVVTNMSENTDKMYVNGVLVATNTPVNSIGGMNTSDLVFGHISWVNQGQSEPFKGALDDIGLWDRPLTECEITELYTTQDCNVGIEELNQGEKEIIRVVDLMGRETTPQKNKVLIYQYSDGTTEKVFEFE